MSLISERIKELDKEFQELKAKGEYSRAAWIFDRMTELRFLAPKINEIIDEEVQGELTSIDVLREQLKEELTEGVE